MKSIQATIETYHDYVTLCFDIDDCLSGLVPSCTRLPTFYKHALLEKIKTIVFPDSTANQILNTQVTLRLFTNRKDALVDQCNATTNHSPLAKDILEEMRNIVSTWLGSGSTLIFDDRLHIEQVDGPSARRYQDTIDAFASAATNQDDASLSPRVFHHKCDLAATILAEHAHTNHQHRVYFFDDRLHPLNEEKGLDTLTQFFSCNPQAIPSNCQIHMVPVDSFIDYKQHVDKLYYFYKKHGHQLNSSDQQLMLKILQNPQFSPNGLNTKRHQDIFDDNLKTRLYEVYGVNISTASDFADYMQHKQDIFDDKLKTILSAVYGVNMSTASGFADYMQQQHAFADKSSDPSKNDVADIITIQGTGHYPLASNYKLLWERILLPITRAYQNFLDQPSSRPSGTNPFACNCTMVRDGQTQSGQQTIVSVQDVNAKQSDDVSQQFMATFDANDKPEASIPVMGADDDDRGAHSLPFFNSVNDHEPPAKKARVSTGDDGLTDSKRVTPISQPSMFDVSWSKIGTLLSQRP